MSNENEARPQACPQDRACGIEGIHYGQPTPETYKLVRALIADGGLSFLRSKLNISRQHAKWLASKSGFVFIENASSDASQSEPHTRVQDAYGPKEERALHFHARLQELGSLQGVADEVGLSRQRVYQIIVTGVKRGLYPSPFKKYRELPPQDEFEDALERAASVSALCMQLRLTPEKLSIALRKHSLSEEAFLARLESNRKRQRVHRLMRRLRPFLLPDGSLPSTYELQSTPLGRNVYSALVRHYGTYDAVRSAARRHFRS